MKKPLTVVDKIFSALGGSKDILPWRGGALSTEHSDNFVRNQATIADVSDVLAATSRSAMGLSATWACVNLVCGTIGSLPLHVLRRQGSISVPAPDHPLYWVLADSPNFDQTAMDFWEFIAAGIELRGNSHALIERRANGMLGSLLPLVDVRARRTASGGIEYRWTEGGKERKAGEKDILHVRGPLGDALGGLSTLATCRGSFDAAMAADLASQRIFEQGIRSSGIFSTDPSIALSKEQRKDLNDLIADRYAGSLNTGRPMVMDRGMKYQALSLNPDDAQMLETRNFGVEEVCRIFGVPPHMIGHTTNNTSWGSGIEQQTLGFVKFSLRRRLKRIEMALEKQLLTRADRDAGISIRFNLEGLLRGDSKNRAEFHQSGLQNKWLTINEVRAQEDLPPVPWGDRPWGQAQDVQLDENGNPPPPAPPPTASEGEDDED